MKSMKNKTMIELVDDYKNFPAFESFECNKSFDWANGLTYHTIGRDCGSFWDVTMDAIQQAGTDNVPALESFECSYSLNWAYGLTYRIISRGFGWYWEITMDAIQQAGVDGEKTMDSCYRNPDTGMAFDTPEEAYEHMVNHSADPKTYRDILSMGVR